MKFALDTNVIAYAIRGEGAVRDHLNREDADEVGIPSMCVFETLRGAYLRGFGAPRLQVINRFFKTYEILPFDERAADHAAHITADLAALGTPISQMDALIAGVARARGLTVVTRNTAEFARVPGLTVVDWY